MYSSYALTMLMYQGKRIRCVQSHPHGTKKPMVLVDGLDSHHGYAGLTASPQSTASLGPRLRTAPYSSLGEKLAASV
jgi:hypothetical protein